jgi:type II secretory pathway component GspD/PulD (secretin)
MNAMKAWKTLIPLAIVLLCLSDLAPASGNATEQKDAQNPVTLSVQNMDIKEVLSLLSGSRRLNILAAGDVAGQVSVDLHAVPFDQALRAVVALAGFVVQERDGIYFVRKPAGEENPANSILKEIRTYQIDYADPEKAVPVIQQILSPIGKVSNYAPQRTLVVEDMPDVLARVDALVESLDRPPRQVLIEARIMEARLAHNMNLGIDWSLFFKNAKGSGDVSVEGFTAPSGSGQEGLFMSWGGGDFAAAIQSLEGVEDLNTLTAPRILATDGTAAHIIIGDELGFPVITTVENTVIQSIQFLSVGAQLRITPTIADDGNVLMEVHPELSNGVVQQGIPSKTTAEVTTKAMIRDGQTLLIGGLIRERDEKTRSGVPILMNLPVIGALFGKTTHTIQKSELITLITPHIVTPANEAEMEKDWTKGALRPRPETR